MSIPRALGPILVGIAGTELDGPGRTQLLHPAVGGVVLFDRNFTDPDQLGRLTGAIRDLRAPRLLICIDQEGGRVQRLRDGFTRLPALGKLGRLYRADPAQAVDYAYRHARVMAGEMLACGIDLSFAPVLDLDRGSEVIGDRAFDAAPATVAELGRAYLAGMHDAGMRTTGKHFPGHGSVRADSHTQDVLDPRPLAEIERTDIRPFHELLDQLDALMIAHVVYAAVDRLPAGYSREWLQHRLRKTYGYRGVVLSDDLGMHAAEVAGDLCSRMQLCLEAGCDLALVCRPMDVEELLPRLGTAPRKATQHIQALYGRPVLSAAELASAAQQGAGEWQHWRDSLAALEQIT